MTRTGDDHSPSLQLPPSRNRPSLSSVVWLAAASCWVPTWKNHSADWLHFALYCSAGRNDLQPLPLQRKHFHFLLHCHWPTKLGSETYRDADGAFEGISAVEPGLQWIRMMMLRPRQSSPKLFPSAEDLWTFSATGASRTSSVRCWFSTQETKRKFHLLATITSHWILSNGW